ncbi:NADH-quinone oxidoreductase subunit NuoK [Arundinibacter roseus]|uniref:NADH-quinone oxidoreductase subunit K n=1 Tax=Arundinibacter roseus TaxID=2070510 RepID=A0A4R4KLK6_9BACT|nr:NADH-quinone oxidoreductase subunit NuoK [Arundinibacter roseus]TDB69158.1 NADH-quinone oxidoreductase subunit NuoK [Arundinibacter roseus]
MQTPIPLFHFLIVAAALFSIGLAVAVTKRSVIGILIGLELMLNAVNLNLIAFSRYDPVLLRGQLFALFVIVVAAAEVTVALALVLRVYHHYGSIDPDEMNQLKH